MNVERVIYVSAAVGTVVLLFVAIRWFRLKRQGRSAAAFAGVVLLHFIGPLLVGPSMRGYIYQAADSKKMFLEVPFKGLRFERTMADYQAAQGGELFRTFPEDWWNFYRWRDYATHPRWKFAYRPWVDSRN